MADACGVDLDLVWDRSRRSQSLSRARQLIWVYLVWSLGWSQSEIASWFDRYPGVIHDGVLRITEELGAGRGEEAAQREMLRLHPWILPPRHMRRKCIPMTGMSRVYFQRKSQIQDLTPQHFAGSEIPSPGKLPVFL